MILFHLAKKQKMTSKVCLNSINFLNPHIHFEKKLLKNVRETSLSCLDMTMELNTVTRNLDFELFIKPSSVELFLNYNNVIINSAKMKLRGPLKIFTHHKSEKA